MRIAVFLSLFFWVGVSNVANASIVSLGSQYGANTITRDTSTGLDWLDVTVTNGLSYNEVSSQMGSGGTYEGWRYATMAEFDQLVVNFGYIAVEKDCDYGALHCDENIMTDSLIVENMIRTLGDTHEPEWISQGDEVFQISPDGTGVTEGILGTLSISSSHYDVAVIQDKEAVRISDGKIHDGGDWVNTVNTGFAGYYGRDGTGSFLVQPSVVPIPAAAWLFGSALLSLGIIKRRKAA